MWRTPIRDKAWFILKIAFSRNHAASFLSKVVKAITLQACKTSVSGGKNAYLPGQPRADKDWDSLW